MNVVYLVKEDFDSALIKITSKQLLRYKTKN